MTRQEAIDLLTAPGEEYELEEIELYGRKCRGFKNLEQTLRDHFASYQSDADFLAYDSDRYTFGEAYQASCKIGAILKEDYGVTKGDRVAISMRNYPEWVLSFQAVTSIGAIAVAMNSLWTTEELEFGLADSGAKVLIADRERVDRVEPALARLQLQVIGVRPREAFSAGVPDLAELLAAREPCDMPKVEVRAEDDATILYTSGSTGHPKGALSCHRNIMSAIRSWELDLKIAAAISGQAPPAPEYQPATLLAVPLFHATGLHAGLLSSYRAQRKVVLMYKWDVERAMELIERERVASFIAPAAMTGDLVNASKTTTRDLSSLGTVGGGGAPRAPEQVKQIASSFRRAVPNTGWGMTETNAIGTGIGGRDYLKHPNSAGRVSAVLDLKIVDENGNTQSPLERGEILITGASVIRGYWNRPEVNADTFTDGWMHTGDVGYLDEEGYLYIVDRIKDLVIRGGENIGCAEVEAALLAHDKIVEASVYAVPDARLGEEVGATLYVSGAVDENELRDFLVEHIARFKLPRYVSFAKEPLPRIATGKIDKRRIREAAVRELGLA